jgi:hypothetical protein
LLPIDAEASDPISRTSTFVMRQVSFYWLRAEKGQGKFEVDRGLPKGVRRTGVVRTRLIFAPEISQRAVGKEFWIVNAVDGPIDYVKCNGFRGGSVLATVLNSKVSGTLQSIFECSRERCRDFRSPFFLRRITVPVHGGFHSVRGGN